MIEDMLTYCRPHGSETEREFVERFVAPLGTQEDAAGNHILRIGDAPILWSCHTDSVHDKPGRQQIVVDRGIVRLRSGSSCLGADDAAGVWLMTQMIVLGVPGLYIFHAGEERGGIGSMHIVTKTPHLLDGIECAIALDRKGTGSVITHMGMRTCSDRFALSLATQLGPDYVPDDTGLFTDTLNYAHLVPECTNISVGYGSAHSSKEYLDTNHLQRLLDRLVSLDVSGLTIERSPDEYEFMDEPLFTGKQTYFDLTDRTGNLIDAILRHPEAVAALLEDYGITEDEIYQATKYERT